MSNNKSEEITCPNYVWRLFQRDGVYYACGRRHGNGKHSLGTRDRQQAIKSLIELDKIAAGSQLAPRDDSIGTASVSNDQEIQIADGWDRYIETRSLPVHLGGLKQSSIRKYRTHKKRFVKYCETTNIRCWSSVDRQLLESYGKAFDGRLAPITIHDDLTMEISVSNWLIKKKLIPNDCKINWRLQKPPGSERYCYERDEVKRMLQLAKTLAKNEWLYPTIMLLSHTGIRIGEACNLKWSDIDFKYEVIHIRDESFQNKPAHERRLVKDKESRIIPIHTSLLKLFTANRGQRGYILKGDHGRKLNYNHALEAFEKRIITPLITEFPTPDGELGFKDGRFHSFRHFFVSECFDAGVPESDIKLWMGHSESKIVKLYRHIRNDTAKANIRLGKFGAS